MGKGPQKKGGKLAKEADRERRRKQEQDKLVRQAQQMQQQLLERQQEQDAMAERVRQQRERERQAQIVLMHEVRTFEGQISSIVQRIKNLRRAPPPGASLGSLNAGSYGTQGGTSNPVQFQSHVLQASRYQGNLDSSDSSGVKLRIHDNPNADILIHLA